MNETTIIKARVYAGGRTPPKRIEGHRVCVNEECTTVLSVYNKEDFCNLHRPMKTIRVRGRAPSEIIDKESAVPHNCNDCISTIGSVFEEMPKALVDGVVHAQGEKGSGTICEGLKWT